MDKVVSKFVISNLKKAIYNLECANKLAPGCVDDEILEELNFILLEVRLNLREEKDNAKQ